MPSGIKHKTGICSIKDCVRKHNSQGLCSMHWIRKWKHGDINIIKNRLGQKHSKETITPAKFAGYVGVLRFMLTTTRKDFLK